MSGSNRLTIGIHFDLICPWCYIGKRHLALARYRFAQKYPEIAVEPEWYPVQLLPDVPEQGLPFAEFYERRLGSPEAVRQRRQQIALAAQSVGLDLDLTRIERLPNTARAHQLLDRVASLDEPGLYETLLDRLFAAYFQRGEDIGDAATLRALAAEVGVPAECAEATSGDASPAADEAAIAGVPHFVFNGRLSLRGAHDAVTLLLAMSQAVQAPAATQGGMNRLRTLAGRYLPGLLASVVVAIAARSLASQYQAPVMLFALLLGMAMNFLSADGACKAGIDLAARGVLRLGVALLGTRITLEQIAALGWEPVQLVVVSVVVTIVLSMLVARVMGFNVLFGLLSGGATAICGASAALALAAALPAHPGKDRATLFTVIGVSALSTVAMIVYPMIVRALELDPIQAGVFLGGTIHDVAQVVGAGYSLSHEIGDTATVVKLMRVAMLLPVIVCAVMITRARGGHESGQRPPLLPWFAVAFLGFAVLGSVGGITPTLQKFGSDLSTWCLVTAIGALGMKIQLKELTTVGIKPVLLMLGQTVFLAALVLGLLWLGA